MKFLDEAIEKYAEAHTSPESPVLKKIHRDTYANVIMPRMLSGHLQGRLLATFSHMIKPRRVLEIGTYTGYSALCMAEGLLEDGKVITIDINEELEEKVRTTFKGSGLDHKIDYRIGNALDVIPTLDEMFDLVFIDADKENYDRYFEMIIEKVQKGGFIMADNVLWSGKVLPGNQTNPDKDTSALINFNLKVHNDTRVENVLLPIRDGLMILKKN